MNGLVACRRGGQRLGKSALHYNLTNESVNYRPSKGGRKPIEAGDDQRRPSSTSSTTSCSSESNCSSNCSLASSIESLSGESRAKSSRTGSKCSSKSSTCSSCYSLFNCRSESKSSSRASKQQAIAFCALCKGQVQYFRVRFASCGHEMHGECCWRYAAKVPTDSELSAGTKCARCHWDRRRARTRQQSVDSIHSNDEAIN